ncbi:uncharacterized protein LOC123403297 isoform X1 [Hordeum vulgare subsp. vulgare]|uniref:uncharacterized protein LOC123403297 isoform X1 n=1 Tax=Hordeum vulgare subsp. vulgare TaxID=112509 RepID=UPI00162E3D73|nr:uncharacterized protein LOC123403297 isoform X1 [Hordeum vulgare subsp. vulgare]
MFEALLNLEPSSNPFPIQQMRSPLLSTWMCRALETEPPSARNHRRNSLMFLSQAREEEGEPKRCVPPVGEPADSPVALPARKLEGRILSKSLECNQTFYILKIAYLERSTMKTIGNIGIEDNWRV